jgi:hypothetical protein
MWAVALSASRASVRGIAPRASIVAMNRFSAPTIRATHRIGAKLPLRC